MTYNDVTTDGEKINRVALTEKEVKDIADKLNGAV